MDTLMKHCEPMDKLTNPILSFTVLPLPLSLPLTFP